jgi:hypothetical protein
MSKQSEWDAIVNAYSAQLQISIDRISADKSSIDARCARLSGGINADTNVLCTELTAQSTRLGQRVTNQTTQKTAVDGRTYASLSGAEQTIVDNVCTNCSLHVQNSLAHTDVSIVAVDTRVTTAKASVDTPGDITQEDEDSLWESTIRRIVQGLE